MKQSSGTSSGGIPAAIVAVRVRGGAAGEGGGGGQPAEVRIPRRRRSTVLRFAAWEPACIPTSKAARTELVLELAPRGVLDAEAIVRDHLGRHRERVAAAGVRPDARERDLGRRPLLQHELAVGREQKDGEGAVQHAGIDVRHDVRCSAEGAGSCAPRMVEIARCRVSSVEMWSVDDEYWKVHRPTRETRGMRNHPGQAVQRKETTKRQVRTLFLGAVADGVVKVVRQDDALLHHAHLVRVRATEARLQSGRRAWGIVCVCVCVV